MATLSDWNAYMGIIQDLAYVEDDLRTTAAEGNQRASAFAKQVLFERFSVDV